MRSRQTEYCRNHFSEQILKFCIDIVVAIAEDGMILMASPSIESAWGWNAEESSGKNISDLLTEASRESFLHCISECVVSGKSATCELVVKRKDHSSNLYELTLHQLDEPNEDAQFIGVFRDISERFRYQNQQAEYLERLKQTRRELKRKEFEVKSALNLAEQTNQAKSEFLSNMSHEIRTPMTAIIGYSEVLKESITQPEQHELIDIIQRNGDHLLQVINDILDISKIELGQYELRTVECFHLKILQELIASYQPKAAQKGLRLLTRIHETIPASIQSDPARLKQVLENLMSNAVKFTDHGSISIEVRVIARSNFERLLQFNIADTGIGISQEKLRHIFDPFTQADSSLSRPYSGTGLGLTLSQKLIQLLGGKLSVQSMLNQGSVFSVTLNIGNQNSEFQQTGIRTESDETKSLSQNSSGINEGNYSADIKGRVLLVDDTQEILRLFSYMLTKMKLDVVTASNGREAIEKFQQAERQRKPYDLILMDMQMPVMDGYEATRFLRSQNHQVPVIAITAHTLITDREKCIAAGCSDYLGKPVKFDVLSEIVSRHLSTIPEYASGC
ncbi:response regulator [Gimesia sp.]|uniref:response regulator n=1 Tax=Gimesia sp. TaxID=2024833 RepID=UPI003A8CCF1E